MLKINHIEEEYNVASIEANGFKVWPIIRFYFAYQIQGNSNIALEEQKNKVKRGILRSFFYGFSNFFAKYDYLVFSDSAERKKINNLYVDKSVDSIIKYLKKSLLIEMPLPKHYRKTEISTNHIVSKIPFYFITKLISLVISPQINNEHLLETILANEKIQLDYKLLLKKFFSQYYLGLILCKIYKPKGMIIQCSYTNGGYVKAFKDSGIKVIEVQHGLITSSHNAYNIIKNIDSSYYPDFLLSYGRNEMKIFNKTNFFIKETNVLPVGHFYIDYLEKQETNDPKFEHVLTKYKKSITISVQEIPSEDKLIRLIIEAANLDKTILFIYKTRFRTKQDYKHYQLPENIQFIDWLDVYELISMTDIHGTMYSTCALEALSLGKHNILIDIDGLSKTHLGSILKNKELSFFARTPNQLVERINNFQMWPKHNIIKGNTNFIKPNYQSNIAEALDKIFR